MKAKLLVALLTALATTSAYACTAFFDYDYVDGMNKICMYKHLGSAYAYTVKSYQICPITIQVPH